MPIANTPIFRKLLYASFAVYAFAVLFGISFHEPWRDEAQSWLVVKNLDFIGLFKKLPSEGHPPSWYLVLFPFAKLGFPYAVQNWISAILMIAAVYILQFKTSLNPFIKLAIPLNYFFLFEYSLIARNYCLAALLVAILIWQYPRRFDRPWIFALCVVGLFNTHMLLFTFCAAITGLYLLDAIQLKKLNKDIIGSLLFMAIGGLYLIPYIVKSDVNTVFEPFVADHAAHIMQAIGQGLLVSTEMQSIAALLLILVCVCFLNNYKVLLLVLGGISGVLYILGYKFAGDIRHAGIMFLVLLFAYGVSAYYKSDKDIERKKTASVVSRYGFLAFLLIILLQVPAAFRSYWNDKENIFSDSGNAAQFLKDNHLENALLAGHFAWAASALLPYLEDGKTIYYAECQRDGSYYVFDSCFVNQGWNKHPKEYIQLISERYKTSHDNVVMVFNYQLPDDVVAQGLENIYQTREATIREDEMYYIYKFRKAVYSQQQ